MLGTLLGILLALVLAAVVIMIVSRLNLGLTVDGFGPAIIAGCGNRHRRRPHLLVAGLLGITIGGGSVARSST